MSHWRYCRERFVEAFQKHSTNYASFIVYSLMIYVTQYNSTIPDLPADLRLYNGRKYNYRFVKYLVYIFTVSFKKRILRVQLRVWCLPPSVVLRTVIQHYKQCFPENVRAIFKRVSELTTIHRSGCGFYTYSVSFFVFPFKDWTFKLYCMWQFSIFWLRSRLSSLTRGVWFRLA